MRNQKVAVISMRDQIQARLRVLQELGTTSDVNTADELRRELNVPFIVKKKEPNRPSFHEEEFPF